MNLLKKIFKEKNNVPSIKDTVVEYSNGVRINFSHLGRVINARKTRDEIMHFPHFFNV